MRWLPYFILAYLIMGLQLGTSGFIELRDGTVRPNFILMGAIWIALNAPRDAALLGSFGLGLIQDLATAQPLGLFAFSYGLVAMFTVNTQRMVYRDHPLTHLAFGLFGSLITAAVLLIGGYIREPRISILAAFYSAFYTAILAPIVLWLMRSVRRLFSFQTDRRTSTF